MRCSHFFQINAPTNKNCFIASSSGGTAIRFQESMHSQLEHLGAIVFKEKIILNSSNKVMTPKQQNHLKEFLKLL